MASHLPWMLLVMSVVSTGHAEDSVSRSFILVFSQNVETNFEPELYPVRTNPFDVTFNVTSLDTVSDAVQRSIVLTNETSPLSVQLPRSFKMNGTEVAAKGIDVHTDSAIALFAFNRENGSCDGYVAFPISSLNTDYFAVCYWRENVTTQLSVAASQDDTSVELTLPRGHAVAVTFRGQTYGEGDTITLTLNMYEAVQIRDVTNDLSGTYVSSSKPVAVFSGNPLADVGSDVGSGGRVDRSHLDNQVPPIATWGWTFYLVPIPGRGSQDLVKIVSAFPQTKINITVIGDITLDLPGDTVMLDIPKITGEDSKQHTVIKSDKPILVALLTRSERLSSSGSGHTDPTMMIIPPTEQFLSSYTLTTPQLSPAADHYVMVAVRVQDLKDLYLDGATINQANWAYQADWLGKAIRISEGKHVLTHMNGKTFGASVFGSDPDNCAYSYAAGTGLSTLTQVPTASPIGSTPEQTGRPITIAEPTQSPATKAEQTRRPATTAERTRKPATTAEQTRRPSTTAEQTTESVPGKTTLSVATTLPPPPPPADLREALCVYIRESQHRCFAGRYNRHPGSHHGKPVFKHAQQDHYLYFLSRSSHQSSSFWTFGQSVGSSRGYILARQDTRLPSEVTGLWGSFNVNTSTWHDDDAIKVTRECSGYPRTSCAAFTVNGPFEERSIEGQFDILNVTLNDRPAYRHVTRSLYLYYHVSSDVCQRWALGPQFGGSVALMYVNDVSMIPETITQPWTILVLGKWIVEPRVYLACT